MKKYFPPPRQFSALAYLCVCLNAVVLKYYELTDEPTFIRLVVEDSLIEDLTAVLLSLAGILLFVTGRMERKALRRWIYVLGGILALFVAGEEISWGQRIFGYPTPDWIAEKNSQNEFNLHNLHFFQNSSMHGFRYGVQLLCMMACMAFLTGRERIRGVPVPSILLTLGLLAILSYDYDFFRPDFPVFTLRTLSGAPNTLICLIITFALFYRQYELLIFSAAAILLSLTLAVVNHLCGSLTAVGFSKREGVEYLITLAIFCYSSDLFLNQKLFLQADHLVRRSTPDQGRASIGLFFRRLVHPVGRRLSCVPDPHPPGNSSRPFWLAIPALSISISIGLMSSAYVTFWSRETYATELAQEIASRKPIIRSHFDVYLSQNRIIYKRENCSRHDISRSFFLYVIRTNLHQSFIARRFTFSEYGTSLYRNASYWDKARNRGERSCFLVYPLSMWGTVSIWTGQESLWEAATLVDQHADGGGGRPTVSSVTLTVPLLALTAEYMMRWCPGSHESGLLSTYTFTIAP